MKIVYKKKSGGYRKLYCVNHSESKKFRKLYDEHLRTTNNAIPFAYGFKNNESSVTAAKKHIGFLATIHFDLKDFFDNVTLEKAGTKIPIIIRKQCFIEDEKGIKAARQGLNTSPAIANIVASDMDIAINNFLGSAPSKLAVDGHCYMAYVDFIKNPDYFFAYTRYADDICISLIRKDSPLPEHKKLNGADAIETLVNYVKKEVIKIIHRHGFKVNDKKTYTQYDKYGHGFRKILGISVNENNIKTTRKFKRKIRVVKFQIEELRVSIYKMSNRLSWTVDTRQRVIQTKKKFELSTMLSKKEIILKSLLEHDKLKPVLKNWENRCDPETNFILAEKFLKTYNNKYQLDIVNKRIKERVFDTFEDGSPRTFITNDPAYFMGISTFTTGWVSCMTIAKSHDPVQLGLMFWWKHPGVSIIARVSKKTIVVNGLKKRRMVSRTLCYLLRGSSEETPGKICFGRIYPGGITAEELRKTLIDNGLITTWEALKLQRSGEISEIPSLTVVGNIPLREEEPRCLPFFDNVMIQEVPFKDQASEGRISKAAILTIRG